MKKKKENYILGITGLSYAFHDNSVALLRNGEIIFAASEERYSHIKHDRNFPMFSINEALKFAKISLSRIDVVAVGYPQRFFLGPFLSRDFIDLLKVLFYWIRGRKLLFFTDALKIAKGEVVQNYSLGLKKELFPKEKIMTVDHHLAHAASSYFTSGFRNCLAVIMDAFGATSSGKLISGGVYLCQDGRIEEKLEEITVNSSMGLFYASVTQALGFTAGDGEGKTMGLAVYGDPKLAHRAMKKISPLFKKGKWQKTPYWAQMFFADRKEFRPIFDSIPLGIKFKKLIEKFGKENVAASAQLILEEEVVKYFRYLFRKYRMGEFALGGGLFLNVKMNKKIREIKNINEIFVHPHAGDGGAALGAASQVYSEKYGFRNPPMRIENVSWGTGYTQEEIFKTLQKYKDKIVFSKENNISKTVARELVGGKVIGWFQGRFEWGPRALGYRSVLVDPRRIDVKDRLNNQLKQREWFMPFAPSVMLEHGDEYFEDFIECPFMTFAFDVKRGKVKDIKAAIHIDRTARPNSVSKENNPAYYSVLKEFQKLSGIPVVLNTSFNKHGLPIINSPKDAIEHLLWNCIDELAIGDYLVKRKQFNA